MRLYKNIFAFLALSIFFSVTGAFGQTSSFTYQGKLTVSGVPADGSYDLRFRLYATNAGGPQVGITTVADDVMVTNGIFTVELNFGPGSITAGERWLEMEVRPGASTGAYTLLSPRQKITEAPYSTLAARAMSADTADTAADANTVGGISPSVLIQEGDPRLSDARQPVTGSPNYVQVNPSSPQSGGFDVLGNGKIGSSLTVTGATFLNSDVSVSGTLSGNGSGLTNLNGANITSNTISAAALAADAFPNIRNLSLLGQRRWDLLGQRVAAGNRPTAAAFDGANIWVTNQLSHDVTKLRASDGAVLGTFAVGTTPVGIAFDGANIWVANANSANVSKLRASDGALLGTFPVGTTFVVGLAFDGANIWVGHGTSSVTKLRASDGAVQGTFTVGTNPRGVVFDGANIWVANSASNNVTKLRASDGAFQGTFAVGTSPFWRMAFDGANIWVANSASNNVTKLRASDGALQGTFAVGTSPREVEFDGENIWVVNSGSGNVTKLRASDGALLGTFAVGLDPSGIAFDGANMWVANVGSNNVTKLPVFP